MEKTQEIPDTWTFERFQPGQHFGTIDLAMDTPKRAMWSDVFGESPGDTLPRGMMVTAMMEAYIRAIQPRPDGNIHASQELAFSGRPARWGDVLRVAVSCADKEAKKGRLWVRFGIETTVRGDTVMTGTIRAIWAA